MSILTFFAVFNNLKFNLTKLNGMAEKDVEKFKEDEERVGKHLYKLAAIVTLIAMGFVLIEFFTKGVFHSRGISYFYVGVVLVYSLHKELIRWIGEERRRHHHGEFFLYGWIGLTTGMYVINFLTKGYFYNLAIEEAAIITIEVLIIFLITRALKLFKLRITKE